MGGRWGGTMPKRQRGRAASGRRRTWNVDLRVTRDGPGLRGLKVDAHQVGTAPAVASSKVTGAAPPALHGASRADP